MKKQSCKIEVGDLVKYVTVPHEFAEYETYIGVVTHLSRTGDITHSAKIVFTDGDSSWHDTAVLEVISAND